MTRLGPVESFRRFPSLIGEGRRTYFLVKQGDGFALLSNICPHERGSVYDKGTHFECPLHGWQFDRTSGRCLNEPAHSLTAVPVVIQDGVLFADIPHAKTFDQGSAP